MPTNGVDIKYVSVVPRAVVHRELEAWDQRDELPIDLRARL